MFVKQTKTYSSSKPLDKKLSAKPELDKADMMGLASSWLVLRGASEFDVSSNSHNVSEELDEVILYNEGHSLLGRV